MGSRAYNTLAKSLHMAQKQTTLIVGLEMLIKSKLKDGALKSHTAGSHLQTARYEKHFRWGFYLDSIYQLC